MCVSGHTNGHFPGFELVFCFLDEEEPGCEGTDVLRKREQTVSNSPY